MIRSMLGGRVPTHPRARLAYGLPPLIAESRVYVLEDGTTLIARADGGLDRVVQGGRPRGGIAEDPTAARRP